MRIDGLWLPDEAGVMRPAVFGLIEISGREYPAHFLVDTGADQTVLGSDFAERLQSQTVSLPAARLVSAGGNVAGFFATATAVFVDDSGRKMSFSLTCAVLTDPAQANTHLLGRDVLDYFALICDREREIVTLLRSPHVYVIES